MRPEPGPVGRIAPDLREAGRGPTNKASYRCCLSSDRRKRRTASAGQRDVRVTTRAGDGSWFQWKPCRPESRWTPARRARAARARQPKRPRTDRNCPGGQPEGVCWHSHPPLSSDSSPGCTKCHRWGIPCIHLRPRKPHPKQPGTRSESTVQSKSIRMIFGRTDKEL